MEQPEQAPLLKIRKIRKDKGVPRAKNLPLVIRKTAGNADESPVRVVINGREIRCVSWCFEGKFLKLKYWPESRGREGFRYVALDGIEDLQIEQPEGMVPQMPVVWTYASGTQSGTANNSKPEQDPSGPQISINPILAARRDPKANTARIVNRPNESNPEPRTEIVGDGGGREVVAAAILS